MTKKPDWKQVMKERREILGLSQDQAEIQARIPIRAWWRLESGGAKYVPPNWARRIAKVLFLDADFFVHISIDPRFLAIQTRFESSQQPERKAAQS